MGSGLEGPRSDVQGERALYMTYPMMHLMLPTHLLPNMDRQTHVKTLASPNEQMTQCTMNCKVPDLSCDIVK